MRPLLSSRPWVIRSGSHTWTGRRMWRVYHLGLYQASRFTWQEALNYVREEET